MAQQARSDRKKASSASAPSPPVYRTVRVQERTYLLLRSTQRHIGEEMRKALESGEVLTYFPLAQVIHLMASEYVRIKGVKT